LAGVVESDFVDDDDDDDDDGDLMFAKGMASYIMERCAFSGCTPYLRPYTRILILVYIEILTGD
jgi:hypothetical protein